MIDIGNNKDLSNVTNKELVDHLLTAKNPILIVSEGDGHVLKSDDVEDIND